MAEEERDGVRLSSLDSPLGDGLEVTKRDLVDHYDAFADRLVPLLTGRPLTIKRVRPGAAPFIQRDVPKGAPDWVRTVPTWSDRAHREVHQVLCEDRRTLLWLANQRAVELHVPFGRVGEEEPTGLVLDLDPPDGADLAAVVAVARLARRALADAGLVGAVKTSGSTGLHVVVPVHGSPGEDVAAATRALAARTERLDPAVATTAYVVAERGGRVFVDSTRSGRGTIAVAYSPRARPGLPVSTPVAWDELDGVRPGDVTVRTARERIGDGDPWADALPEPQRLPADLVAEGHTIPVARVAAMHEGKRRARARAQEQPG
ncbi:DNA polymerase domain-containing protein [Modestobacter roseus]|uniref:DNA ligase D-like protein (Predicted polymerase) n=1 Tax=Modestobacter roseus TaxID=1181884 RepID=A0A562IMI6_9ACTN|nr:ATP-dependent DNA ligase [Modestobacter roseus]MQA34228.1 ATP-dependent DNA ligase [Modestobacter roseus]TWH71935.1 DNA ligase D-like protein (predicted polymerase) [Modestobacter roseus]